MEKTKYFAPSRLRATPARTALAIVAGCGLILPLVGCVHSKSEVRPSSQSQATPSLIDPEEDSPLGTRTILKNQDRAPRSPGGWSSQANAVEEHLGVR